ncbi:MAG TPA: MFS transporter [Stellaceae bacterium]|nr:MFS transporter [Stellaceae bacterium]
MSLPVESAPALLSATERRWSLAAAISSVTVFGIGIGLGGPLLALVLEARGTDATLNGLSAASTFIGVILGPLLTPVAVGRIGIRRFLLGCLALDIALFLLMKLTDSIAAWFVLRLMLGIVGSSIFTATEAWINLLAGDAGRGRILGLYVASLSAGFGAGPLLLSVTGIAGWTPFIAASLIVAIAALPLLAASDGTSDLGRTPALGPLAVFAEQPLLIFTVALFGLYEAAVMTLLPIWGVRIGLGDRLGAATVSAIYFGAIALQVPIGWLSDKIERRLVLRLCATAGLAGAALLPLASATMPALFALLFLWGGFTTAIYPIALTMAGERFRGAALVNVNAAIVIGYGLGALAGPVLGGAALDAWNPQGLPALLALLFAVLAATTVARRG